MLNRRGFLSAGLWAGARTARGIEEPLQELWRLEDPPEPSAADEGIWRALRVACLREEGFVNLNHGGLSPTPAPVLAALRHETEFALRAPADRMWTSQDARREAVRARLVSHSRVRSCTGLERVQREGLHA